MSSLPVALLRTLPIVFALSACGPRATATAHPTALPIPASESATSAPVPSGPVAGDPTPGGTAQQIGQTDTAWGRIWDAVPAAFPTYPGSTPTDDVSAEPASGRWVVAGGDPQEIAAWMQAALETATFSTEALSGPFEDGGFVLDLVGDQGCRIQIEITPLGGATLVLARYGAACPAS